MNDGIQILDTDAPINENTTYTPYERINFENGKLVKPGIVDFQTGEFTMPEYDGKTPVNDVNLNHLEDGIKNLENYVLVNGGGAGGGSSDPIGTVKAFAGSIIPDDYLDCDGEQHSVTEHSDLYAVIGTTFNLPTDNDPTKFRTPNLKGRVIVGVGSFDATHSFTLAKTGGELEHKLTTDETAEHYHQGLKWAEPNGRPINLNTGSSGVYIQPNWTGADAAEPSPIYTGKAGGGKAHNNMQPYMALHYIIKAVKTTPLMAEVEDSLESDSTTNAPSIHAVTKIEEFQLDLTNTKCEKMYVNKLRLQNRLVIFDFEAVVANLPNGYSLIGKVPTKILPITSGYYSDVLMYFPIVLSGMNRIAFGRILKNGDVEVYSDTITASQTGYIPKDSYIRIHTSWFTN